MGRRQELEHLARSLAALPHGQTALSRDQALALMEELAELQGRHDELVAALRRLVDEAGA